MAKSTARLRARTSHQKAARECNIAAAGKARLHYSTDTIAGIRRISCGHGFRYILPNGRAVADTRVLERIRKLAIPPAWTHVWINPHPKGHLQATGRDAKGRKQYRYHVHWRAIRDETKFDRLIAFARALPRIRRRVQQDLRRRGLPREKVLATIVQLLEATLIRVGNPEYARANGSIGLTTMHDGHARINKNDIRFEFRGKGGVRHRVTVRDRRLARIVRSCQTLPGQDLFQYLDENNRRHKIGSAAVNAYLRGAGGGDFSAKDFRTWAATLLAARALRAPEDADLVRCVAEVARALGHTPAVCRKCYIHPAILAGFCDGSLNIDLKPAPRRRSRTALTTEETSLLNWLSSLAPLSARKKGSG